MVDTTQSIKQKNINELKTVLKNLVQQFDISNDGAHIALETFGDKSVIHNLFDEPKFFEKNSITNLIDEKIDKLTKPTRLDLALEKADLELFTRENGDRHGVRSVMVLFTDGRSHPTETEKKKYKEHLRSIKVRDPFVFNIFSRPFFYSRPFFHSNIVVVFVLWCDVMFTLRAACFFRIHASFITKKGKKSSVFLPFFRLIVCWYEFFQSKGVRVVVLAIGPDAQKPSYQKVLKELGGENVLSAHDYGSLVGALSDVVNIICREL